MTQINTKLYESIDVSARKDQLYQKFKHNNPKFNQITLNQPKQSLISSLARLICIKPLPPTYIIREAIHLADYRLKPTI